MPLFPNSLFQIPDHGIFSDCANMMMELGTSGSALSYWLLLPTFAENISHGFALAIIIGLLPKAPFL